MPYNAKRWTSCASLILLLCCLSSTSCAQPNSEIAFTIPEKDLIPEGIAYDATTQTFYVSSTYKRKIVRIDASGTVHDFTKAGQEGLWGVLGMRVDAARKHLWVATSHAGSDMPMQAMNLEEQGGSGIFKYDLETGTLIKKYILSPDPEAHFFNDLVVNAQGDVFITDSYGQAVYTISHQRDSLELFLPLEKADFPNGITLSDDERYLFLALWGDVGRIRLSDRAFSLLTMPKDVSVHADGLYFYRNTLITIEPFDTLKVINRYDLSKDYDAIAQHEVIEADHLLFSQPTTGVIVRNQLYYIANGQLQIFRQLYDKHGEQFQRSRLHDVVVLKVKVE